MRLLSQLLRRRRQKNCLNPGGSSCSERRSRHCTPAWETEQDSVSKKKKKKEYQAIFLPKDPGNAEILSRRMTRADLHFRKTSLGSNAEHAGLVAWVIRCHFLRAHRGRDRIRGRRSRKSKRDTKGRPGVVANP